MNTKYRLMMFVDGAEVPSSCVKVGTLAQCAEAARRLARTAHASVTWRALPLAV